MRPLLVVALLLMVSVPIARSAERKTTLPITGSAVVGLEALDNAMLQFMSERNFRAGTLAVLREGKLVYSRGYGFAQRNGRRLVAPDDPFRIASITKPFTAAAIRQLMAQDKFRADTRVMDYLELKPPLQGKFDPRWKDITIGHLLEHRGGWDSKAAPLYDPMFQSLLIAYKLRQRTPPGPNDIIRFMLEQPLHFTPGTKSVYSNFGYCLLGRVIEKASGQNYVDYLQKELLAPLNIKSVALARTLPALRHPREPEYFDPATTISVLNGRSLVRWPDGGFYIEAMDSHGGLIANAPDLVRFFREYSMDGRKGSNYIGTFFGSLPGTWTLVQQRPDGIVYAALFNQRSADPSAQGGEKDNLIKDMLNQAIDSIKKWP
jgi:CubicO group peptidase (beta-lactamase class C family)